MTHQSTIPPFNHDAVIATLVKDAEDNLEALLMVNGALSCLSKMVLRTTMSNHADLSQLGCLIWLSDQRLDQITDDMLLQTDEHPSIKPAI